MHRATSGARKSSTGPVATRPNPCGPMQPHRSPSPSPPDSTVGNRSHDPASRLASTPLIGMTLNYAVAGDTLLAGRHAHCGAEIRNRRGSRRQRSGNNESGRSGKATYSAASARLTGSFQSASRDPGNPSVRSRTHRRRGEVLQRRPARSRFDLSDCAASTPCRSRFIRAGTESPRFILRLRRHFGHAAVATARGRSQDPLMHPGAAMNGIADRESDRPKGGRSPSPRRIRHRPAGRQFDNRLPVRPAWGVNNEYMVGARGFEPPTTSTPRRCATRLRYAPIRETPAAE